MATSGLVIAIRLAQLDNMIVVPELSTIVGGLGGLDHSFWVTTGYILATTVATAEGTVARLAVAEPG